MRYIKPFLKIIPAICVALAIIHVQTLTDYRLGLLGWEMPKVEFLQSFGIGMIMFMGIIAIVIKAIDYRLQKEEKKRSEKGKLNYVMLACILFLVSLLLISVGSLTNTIGRQINPNSYNEFYNEIIEKSFSPGEEVEEIEVNQAIYGNFYRDQGLITFLILISFIAIFSLFIDRNGILILFSGILFSAIHQANLGIQKYSDLYNSNSEHVVSKDSIFGTFGQPNWYFGHLFIGLIAIIFFIELIWKRRKKIQDISNKILDNLNLFLKKLNLNLTIDYQLSTIIYFIPNIVLLFSLAFILTAIYMSGSEWGYIITIITLMILVCRQFINPKDFKLMLIALLLAAIIFCPIFVNILGKTQPNQKHRANIIEGVVDYYILNKTDKSFSNYSSELLFGTGFDTLGENLYELKNDLQYTYNDRAHNIVFDILAFTGVSGLVLFFGIIIYSFKAWNSSSIIQSYVLVGLMLIIIRTLIHEYSITNTFDLLILIAMALSLVRVKILEN